MHVGEEKSVGGRLGDAAATGMSKSLRSLGFTLGRFKTGTPARLLKDSIDWSRCEAQPGEVAPRPFSLRTPRPRLAITLSCWAQLQLACIAICSLVAEAGLSSKTTPTASFIRRGLITPGMRVRVWCHLTRCILCMRRGLMLRLLIMLGR